MRGQNGFTLLEVLVAVVILAVSFTILIQGFQGVTAQIDAIENYTFIASWAENKLNELAAGIEYGSHGTFYLFNRQYRWWLTRTYLNETFQKLRLVVQWSGQEGLQKYFLERLIITGR